MGNNKRFPNAIGANNRIRQRNRGWIRKIAVWGHCFVGIKANFTYANNLLKRDFSKIKLLTRSLEQTKSISQRKPAIGFKIYDAAIKLDNAAFISKSHEQVDAHGIVVD